MSAIVLPNAARCFTYSTAYISAPSASPMPRAATTGRIEFRPSIARRKPPISPTTLSAGTRTSSSMSSPVSTPFTPILSSVRPTDTPGDRAVDDEARDVGVRARVGRAGLGEHAVPVGLHHPRHPALGAVEHPVVAVADGLRAHARPRRCPPAARRARSRRASRRSRRRARSAASAPRCPAISTGPVGRRVSSSISAAVFEYFATSSMATVRPRMPAPDPPYSSGITSPSRPVSRKSSKRSWG